MRWGVGTCKDTGSLAKLAFMSAFLELFYFTILKVTVRAELEMDPT